MSPTQQFDTAWREAVDKAMAPLYALDAKEIAQMRAAINRAVLILEGRPK